MVNYGEVDVVSNTRHRVLWGVKILVRISNAEATPRHLKFHLGFEGRPAPFVTPHRIG